MVVRGRAVSCRLGAGRAYLCGQSNLVQISPNNAFRSRPTRAAAVPPSATADGVADGVPHRLPLFSRRVMADGCAGARFASGLSCVSIRTNMADVELMSRRIDRDVRKDRSRPSCR